ncbi:MAG: hypothetical protein IKO42_00580, partial [Opitutales bacterium]|nr:hypothetical protein [Opitutales bacterium]
MGSKKLCAALICLASAALALCFGLFAFCEHKINWDAVAANAAAAAADAGCAQTAADLAGSIKYKQLSGRANAHIALYKRRNFGAQEAKNFITSCGKYFDFEEYKARLMLEEIAAEPDFAPGFFKMKYLPAIRGFKNPYLQALLYYKLALRANGGAANEHAKSAFDILKQQPRCKNKERAFIEIAQMAFEK